MLLTNNDLLGPSSKKSPLKHNMKKNCFCQNTNARLVLREKKIFVFTLQICSCMEVTNEKRHRVESTSNNNTVIRLLFDNKSCRCNNLLCWFSKAHITLHAQQLLGFKVDNISKVSSFNSTV